MGEEAIPATIIENTAYRGYRIVKLKPQRQFIFSPGQNAEFEISQNICRECGSKTFSIASSPTEGFIMFATLVEGRESLYKRTLEKMRPGDEINIWGPYGHFTLEKDAGEIVMIFHSIGVTPIRSMVVYSSDTGSAQRILAIHIDEKGDFLFKEDLENATKRNKNIRVLWRREMLKTSEISELVRDLEKPVFYISGPPQRVRDTISILRNAGVELSREKIKVESFTGY
ncbi:MAG: FAD-dependent oxidoreductase [Sulfolobales archaeon]